MSCGPPRTTRLWGNAWSGNPPFPGRCRRRGGRPRNGRPRPAQKGRPRTGASGSRGGKEPPPLCSSSCHGDAGGAAANPGAHGPGGDFEHGGLYAKNGPQRLCAPGGPFPGAGAGVPPAAVRQQSQSGGAPCEHLRRPLPQRAPGAPKGLRRFVGASLRTVGEAGPGGGPVTRGSGPGRSPAVPVSGHRVQRAKRNQIFKSLNPFQLFSFFFQLGCQYMRKIPNFHHSSFEQET